MNNLYQIKIRDEDAILVLNRVKELNNGWEPNWYDTREDKYTVSLNVGQSAFMIVNDKVIKHKDSGLYLKSIDLCRQLIRELPYQLASVLGLSYHA